MMKTDQPEGRFSARLPDNSHRKTALKGGWVMAAGEFLLCLMMVWLGVFRLRARGSAYAFLQGRGLSFRISLLLDGGLAEEVSPAGEVLLSPDKSTQKLA